jgi:hypothetical protein
VSSDEPDDVRLRVSFRANYQAVIAEVWKLNGTKRAVDFVKHRRKACTLLSDYRDEWGQVLISPLIGMWPPGGTSCIPWQVLQRVPALSTGQSVAVGFDHAGDVKELRLAREEQER